MKKLYALLIILFFQGISYAQDSQLFYQGHFFNTKNKPQKNLIITNKTSGNYEFTDDKGYLIIEGKLGDTLVWNKKDFKILSYYDLKEIKEILQSKTNFTTVNAIISADYSVDFEGKMKVDSTDFIRSKINAKNTGGFSDEYQFIKKLDTIYEIRKKVSRKIFYSGSLQISNEFGSPNVQPKLQNRFVQGRNTNGILNWNEPETSEMFSFGPDISTMGFNGNPYEYDINGSLVNQNNSISPAKIYNNSIIQNTQKSSTFFSLNSYYEREGRKKMELGLDLGWVREDLSVKNQFQDNKSFGISLGKNIFQNHKLTFNYKFNEDKATNTNRIGLFNRAYQNSLLTPISFENSQGNLLSNKQRSYSLFADNPNYLLQNSRKYNFNFNQNIFNLKWSKDNGDFQYSIEQSYENTQFSNFDQYKKFTYGFPQGIETERNQNNKNYNLNLSAFYDLSGNSNNLNKLHFNSIFNNLDTEILYSNFENYRYNRFSQDFILRYQFRFRDFIFDDFTFEGEVGNGMYTSSTTLKDDFFIPKIALNFDIQEFILYRINVRFFGTLYRNVYEPDFSRSYSNFLLTQINNQELNTYFPIQEVQSFGNLKAINNLESKLGVRLYHDYSSNYLEGTFTNKQFKNDVFPVYENGKIVLKNIADHNTKSYDLNLSFQNFPLRNSNLQIAFNKTISEVKNVFDDNEILPISGFNSIYRGIVKGKALGVLIGTAYEKSANGNVIIGNDGFPLVAAENKILGNPIPDFVMKFSYTQNIKKFSLNVDFEWQKGGDIWNGTNANLDYYGRSENSAQQRNFSNYIFDGVLQNGSMNNIPIDFFNVNHPFEQNKFYRYGSLSVAEDYIVKGDALRIHNITLSYNFREVKFLKNVKISAFAKNILLWSKNNLDPQTSFFDTENGQGLNFYNLPSMRSYGTSISFIF